MDSDTNGNQKQPNEVVDSIVKAIAAAAPPGSTVNVCLASAPMETYGIPYFLADEPPEKSERRRKLYDDHMHRWQQGKRN